MSNGPLVIENLEQAQSLLHSLNDGTYEGDMTAALAALKAFSPALSSESPVSIEESRRRENPELYNLGRSMGLGTRGIAQGVAGLAGIVNDPFAYLLNLGVEAAGGPEEAFPPLRQGVSELLTEAGLPEAETKGERIAEAITEGGAAGLATMGIGSIPAIISKAPLMARILGHPLEFFGGASAGGGSSVAREAGAGTAGQIGAGLASALAIPTVAGAARFAQNVARTGLPGIAAAIPGVRGYTQSGRAAQVGEELVEKATDPQAAIRALEDTTGEVVYVGKAQHPTVQGAGEVVPGSVPTTGVASAGDVGLAAAEAGQRSVFPQIYGPRTSQQNAARRAYLESQIDELGDPAALRVVRDRETAAAREAAFSHEGLTDLTPVTQHIDNVLKGSAGERVAVKEALTWLKGRLAKISPEPRRLYELRKDINDIIKGKGTEGTSGWIAADSELIAVRKVLDDAIEKSAPGFKEYIAEYARLSNIARQSERMIEILLKSSKKTSLDSITGQEMISQSQFKNLIGGERARTGIRKVLTDEQLIVLDKIAADLDRGMSWMSPVVRAPGTTTPRDTLGNAIGEIFKGTIGQSAKIRLIMKPFSWIRQLSAGKRRDLMAEAMLDPKLAAMLMRDATVLDAQRLARGLYDKFVSLSTGASLAMASGDQEQ